MALHQKTPAQRRALLQRRQQEAAKLHWAAMERERRALKEHKEHEARLRAPYNKAQFSVEVMNTSAAARNAVRTRTFIVWKSESYPPDGWHSYDGLAEKEFVSSWATKKQANSRARYLFFWDNTRRVEPDELDEVSARETDGFARFSVCPPDSEEWKVSVVPLSAFAHILDWGTARVAASNPY